MKKFIAITMMMVVFAGCGTKTVYVTETTKVSETTKAPTTTVKPVETTMRINQPIALSSEDQLLLAVQQAYGKPIYVSDQTILDIAYMMCDHFRAGGDSWTASGIIVDALPYDPDTQVLATIITAAGVVYLCPDQSYKLK